MAKASSAGEQVKQLLGDHAQRISLHDLVVAKTREVVTAIAEHEIQHQGRWAVEELQEQLQWFESATAALRSIETLVAYWGEPYHHQTLELPLTRLASDPAAASSARGRHPLDWYPVLLVAYCTGVAAVAASRYDNLAAVLHVSIATPAYRQAEGKLGHLMIDGTSDLVELLKILPEHKKHIVPRSEYLYTLINRELDELIYLESRYETHFDRFEVLLALEYAHLDTVGGRERAWGPPGRFAWKFRREMGLDPFRQVLAEAERQGDAWTPIRAGLFGGSTERFREISAQYANWLGQASRSWH